MDCSKKPGERDALICWRFKKMLELTKQLPDITKLSALARENKHIRIRQEDYRAISLDYKNKASNTGYCRGGSQTIETIMDHFKKIPATRTTRREEAMLHAWLIKEALMNNRDLVRPLNLGDKFDKLLFCYDEVSIGDQNHKPEIRCDLLALGYRKEQYFPVVIELKYTRSQTRLIEQLDNFINEFKLNSELRIALNALLSEFAKDPSEVRHVGEFERIIVWPKCENPKKQTISKMEGIIQVQYSYDQKDKDEPKHWIFRSS